MSDLSTHPTVMNYYRTIQQRLDDYCQEVAASGISVLGISIFGSVRDGNIKHEIRHDRQGKPYLYQSDIDVICLLENPTASPASWRGLPIMPQSLYDGFYRADELPAEEGLPFSKYTIRAFSVLHCERLLQWYHRDCHSTPLFHPIDYYGANGQLYSKRWQLLMEYSWIIPAFAALRQDGVPLPESLNRELDKGIQTFNDFMHRFRMEGLAREEGLRTSSETLNR